MIARLYSCSLRDDGKPPVPHTLVDHHACMGLPGSKMMKRNFVLRIVYLHNFCLNVVLPVVEKLLQISFYEFLASLAGH